MKESGQENRMMEDVLSREDRGTKDCCVCLKTRGGEGYRSKAQGETGWGG